MWKSKLSSPKFWALIAALFVSVADALGAPVGSTERIVAIICAVGACVMYMLAEAHGEMHHEGGGSDGK